MQADGIRKGFGLIALAAATWLAGTLSATSADPEPAAYEAAMAVPVETATFVAPPRGLANVVREAKTHRLPPASRSARKAARLERRWRYERNRFSDLIEQYAAENGVPIELAHAMIEIESRFRPNVKGRHGEIGLMQIKPATARLVGFRGTAKALYDPETNIKYGMRYLAKAHRLGGDRGVCGTILKYNAGHGARRMNPISRRYCEKVKAVFARNDRRWKLEEAEGRAYALLDSEVPLPTVRASTN